MHMFKIIALLVIIHLSNAHKAFYFSPTDQDWTCIDKNHSSFCADIPSKFTGITCKTTESSSCIPTQSKTIIMQHTLICIDDDCKLETIVSLKEISIIWVFIIIIICCFIYCWGDTRSDYDNGYRDGISDIFFFRYLFEDDYDYDGYW